MIRPLQTIVFPSLGTQQSSTVSMQAGTLPAQTDTGLDISELFSLMITFMIVVMMMKMMTDVMREV